MAAGGGCWGRERVFETEETREGERRGRGRGDRDGRGRTQQGSAFALEEAKEFVGVVVHRLVDNLNDKEEDN